MSLLKSAAIEVGSLEDAVQLATARQMQMNTLRRLGLAGLGLAGVGAAARGVSALHGLYRRNIKKQKRPASAPVSMQIPIPAKTAEDQGLIGRTLTGGAVGLGVGAGLGGMAGLLRGLYSTRPSVMNFFKGIFGDKAIRQMRNQAIKRFGVEGAQYGAGAGGGIGALVGGLNKEGGLLGPGSFLQGDQAVTPAGIPWAIPAGLAAGLGGLYGGWKVADKLLDSRRKAELEGELESAQTEYEQALMNEYKNKGKTASDSSAAVELDRLYDQFCALEKTAGFSELASAAIDPTTYTNAAGALTGAYGVGALGSGAITAALVYNHFKKRQESELLRRAQSARRRKMYESQPSPLYAEPVSQEKESFDRKDLLAAVPGIGGFIHGGVKPIEGLTRGETSTSEGLSGLAGSLLGVAGAKTLAGRRLFSRLGLGDILGAGLGSMVGSHGSRPALAGAGQVNLSGLRGKLDSAYDEYMQQTQSLRDSIASRTHGS